MMTLEEYLMPDPSLRAPLQCTEFLPDEKPSLSSRKISLHSVFSVHGFDFFDGRQVWYEAELELRFPLLARMRPDVEEIAEQPPAIILVGDDGGELCHTFDFLMKMKNGTRGFVAVKPSALVEKTGIGRLVQLAAQQIPLSTADWVLLFTEQDLSQIDLFNADQIHHARRDPRPEDDVTMDKVIRKLEGASMIGDLVEQSGLGGYGFDAVVRAIADGKLRLTEYCRLDFNTEVVRVRNRGA